MEIRMTKPITYDIPTFCHFHNISRGMFYKLLKQNLGPRLMRVGKRTIITEDSAAEWRHIMEKKSA